MLSFEIEVVGQLINECQVNNDHGKDSQRDLPFFIGWVFCADSEVTAPLALESFSHIKSINLKRSEIVFT